MPGYHLWVALHGLLGAIALLTFWSAAFLKKGSPRHRAIGKVFLLSMAGIVLTGVPLVIEFAFFRHTMAIALFLTFLLPLTAQACWTAWRAVTDKADWRALVARPGWKLAQVLPALLALPVLWVGLRQREALFAGFALIPLYTAWTMHRFAKRGPEQRNWHVVMHYQAMLGAGIATHVAFLTIGMRPVWDWLATHTAVPRTLIELFPWFAPVAVAVVAGARLGRTWNRKGVTPVKPAVSVRPSVGE